MNSVEAELTKEELLQRVRGFERVLLVHGKESFDESGASKDLAPLIARNGTRCVTTPGGDPTVDGITGLLEKLEGEAVDGILAVGGGSVMDTGKLLKAFWGAPQRLREGLEFPALLQPAAMPVLAMPTLVGSGSEVTHFAVIYEGPTKFSIADSRLRPQHFAYCADYVRHVPTRSLAASALDALCQAIESYWSIYATESSRALARDAVRILMNSLRNAVQERSLEAIEALQRGVNLAGRAIDVTKTTAPHAVSYALTSCYSVSHGHAVALLLPMFFAFNDGIEESDCLDARGVEFVKQTLAELRALLGVADNRGIEDLFAAFLRDFGLESSLGAVGICTADDLGRIVAHGFNPQRVNNNPRKLTEEHLLSLLSSQVELPAQVT